MPKGSKRRKKRILLIVLSIVLIAIGFYLFRSYTPTKTNTINIFFLKDEVLTPVKRILPEKGDALQIIAQVLSKGPSKLEKDAGFYTEIPKNAVIVDADRIANLVIVDFNSALENYGGGATRVQGLIGQIVYSFTDLPQIDEVKITVSGKEEVILGGEGYVIDKPLSRSDITI